MNRIRIPGGMDDYILQYKMQQQMNTDIKKVKVRPVSNAPKERNDRDKNLDYYRRNGVYLEFSEAIKEAQERCR